MKKIVVTDFITERTPEESMLLDDSYEVLFLNADKEKIEPTSD